jgi:hypothetical protein
MSILIDQRGPRLSQGMFIRLESQFRGISSGSAPSGVIAASSRARSSMARTGATSCVIFSSAGVKLMPPGARRGFQWRGAEGVFESVDLVGEGGFSDAEVCLAAWLRLGRPGIARSRWMRCSAPRAARTVQIGGGECFGVRRGRRGCACARRRHGGSRVRDCERVKPGRTAGMPAAMSANERWLSSYCSRSQRGSRARRTSRGTGGPIPLLARSLLMSNKRANSSRDS